MKKYWYPLMALALLVCGHTLFAQPVAQRVDQALRAGQPFAALPLFKADFTQATTEANLREVLHSGLVLQWDAAAIDQLLNAKAEWVTFELPIATGKTLTLQLYRANVLTPEFQVRTAARSNEPLERQGVHYWGIVAGDSRSLVAISIFEREVMGMVSTDAGSYVLGALVGDRAQRHIIYRTDELIPTSSFSCFTDDKDHYIGQGQKEPAAEKDANNCVRMYVETDYDLFVNKGSVANVTNYITGAFSQVAILYANESINFSLNELYVWNVVDPYTGSSTSNYLTQFRNAKNGVYNGNLAHLVGLNGGGGIAYLDVLCNAYYGVGYSAVQASYNNVPTYSWTIEVLTHEIGHNLGSPHTHACAWNGNNTAIDGCGPAAGYSEGCNASVPAQGTIMSYCHLVSGVGINFNLGFGPQPGDLIRNRVYNGSCLTSCGGGGGGECIDNEVTVSITFDNYPEETSWQITNSGGTVVASGGTYGSSPDGSTVNINVCLPDGCYDFTILDSYGDGICCAYGNGSYTVTDAASNVLASGGSFGASETTSFCVPGGGGGGGCTYAQLNSANFDANWGIWTDGGTDCARINSATYANSGTYSIRLRDNTSSSVMSTTNQNYSAYSELTVTFSFITVSFENGEDFWVQVSTNGGSSYTTVATATAGTNFVNGTRYNASVVIPGPFTSSTRLRFRADASADDDQVYIDDVVINGCSGGSIGGGAPALSTTGLNAQPVTDLLLYPNPASEQLWANLWLETPSQLQVVVTDLTGRPVWQQNLAAEPGALQLPIDTRSLAPGSYQLTVTTATGRTTRQFVVIH